MESREKTKLKAAAQPAAARHTIPEPPEASIAAEPRPIPEDTAKPVKPSKPTVLPPSRPAPPTREPSAEVLELATWAKGIRPELERLVLDWCLLLPLLWVQLLIKRRVLSDPTKWTGSRLISYLTKPLTEWEQKRSCDLLPGSTFENPTGKVTVTHFQADPTTRRPVLTPAEKRAITDRMSSPDHVPFWKRPDVAALV